MNLPIDVRCFCGQLSATASSPVLWAGICHCESCRRATSSPFTAFFGVIRNHVAWRGDHCAIATSSNSVERWFCPECGSQMAYLSTKWPDEIHLYAAALSDPSQFQPKAHFHYAERLPWVAFEDDLPKYIASADSGETI